MKESCIISSFTFLSLSLKRFFCWYAEKASEEISLRRALPGVAAIKREQEEFLKIILKVLRWTTVWCLWVIQGVFEIANRFWARKNRRPNFDKLIKNKVFTKPLLSEHRANHKLPSMYVKHCKPVFQFVFVVIIDDFLHFNIS